MPDIIDPLSKIEDVLIAWFNTNQYLSAVNWQRWASDVDLEQPRGYVNVGTTTELVDSDAPLTARCEVVMEGKPKHVSGIIQPPTSDTFVGNFTANVPQDRLSIPVHGLVNNDKVRLALSAPDNVLPAPLVEDIYYFVVNAQINDFQVALTSGGSAIDLTDNGVGKNAVWKLGAPLPPVTPTGPNVIALVLGMLTRTDLDTVLNNLVDDNSLFFYGPAERIQVAQSIERDIRVRRIVFNLAVLWQVSYV